MNNFVFYSPTYFVFGRGKETSAGAYVRRFGGSKVLLHYGGGSVVISGLLDRVKKSLEEEGLSYVELGGVQPNPRSGLVYEGIDLCRSQKVDFILAVGGGSVIDSAKSIAAGVPYQGDFLDFYRGKANGVTVTEALPVGTVLTISAAGSEGSPNCVITDEKTQIKFGATGEALRPKFSILNPELPMTLPPYQMAAGATDMMAHIFERYFTNTKEVEITDRFCEATLLTLIREAPRAVSDPHNYDAQANVMWSGMVAHNDICGVGREQDWSSHAIEHSLSAVYDVTHGAGLAVVFPAWMTYVLDQDVSRFAQLAVRVWGCSMDFADPRRTALEGIQRFRTFLKSIGMPLTLGELGIQEPDLPLLVEKSGATDSKPIGKFVPLYAKDVRAIYELAMG